MCGLQFNTRSNLSGKILHLLTVAVRHFINAKRKKIMIYFDFVQESVGKARIMMLIFGNLFASHVHLSFILIFTPI